VALAALLDGRLPVQGRRVLVYATGGNVSVEAFARHLAADTP
jgi:threonine dehydratase